MYRHIPIQTLIPQRPPMVMVDALHHCDRLHTRTTYTVATNGLFVSNGHLSAVGLIENMAQTIAARMGYLSLYGPSATGTVRVGVIGAIRNLTVHALPAIGELLTTSVDLVEEWGDLILVKAAIVCQEQTLAGCEMVVSLI